MDATSERMKQCGDRERRSMRKNRRRMRSPTGCAAFARSNPSGQQRDALGPGRRPQRPSRGWRGASRSLRRPRDKQHRSSEPILARKPSDEDEHRRARRREAATVRARSTWASSATSGSRPRRQALIRRLRTSCQIKVRRRGARVRPSRARARSSAPSLRPAGTNCPRSRRQRQSSCLPAALADPCPDFGLRHRLDVAAVPQAEHGFDGGPASRRLFERRETRDRPIPACDHEFLAALDLGEQLGETRLRFADFYGGRRRNLLGQRR